MLEQLLLSHVDIKPAMVVHAITTAVEPFGAIVQLGDGLKGLCPIQHMSEFQRVAPSPKFKVNLDSLVVDLSICFQCLCSDRYIVF